jgi:hypothetical protein
VRRALWVIGVLVVAGLLGLLFERLIDWLGDQGAIGHVVIWAIVAGLLLSLFRARTRTKPSETS